jgi:hypothetical protein
MSFKVSLHSNAETSSVSVALFQGTKEKKGRKKL